MDLSELDRLQKTNDVADVLRRARALIDAPEKWIQRAAKIGGRMCMFGALSVALGSKDSTVPAGDKSLRLLSLGVGGCSVSRFNDAPERTHTEVLAAFDRAIALAESA